jgi:hypothetical protein
MEKGCIHLRYQGIGTRQLDRHPGRQRTASLALGVATFQGTGIITVMLIFVDNKGLLILGDMVMLHQIITEYKTKCYVS